MPDKQPVLFTFHKIREQCELGDADAWRAFLNFYGPLWLGLLDVYLPGDAERHSRVLEKLLGVLSANNFEGFRATSRQSEREFLADVRALLLDTAEGFLAAAEPAHAGDGRAIDGDKLAKLLEGLPLMHQEMLFFKLAGYTDGAIELMLRVSPSVAEKAFERLPAPAMEVQQQGKNRCPWPGEWLAVLREARAAKKENCTERHQLLRIQDGQVSWYDKEPAENHAASCLHCLESWTAVREVTYWRRAAPPVSTRQVEEFLRVVPLAVAPKRSLLSRVFGS
jgi:hypothetical protein